jgi:hypothetical protein
MGLDTKRDILNNMTAKIPTEGIQNCIHCMRSSPIPLQEYPLWLNTRVLLKQGEFARFHRLHQLVWQWLGANTTNDDTTFLRWKLRQNYLTVSNVRVNMWNLNWSIFYDLARGTCAFITMFTTARLTPYPGNIGNQFTSLMSYTWNEFQ